MDLPNAVWLVAAVVAALLFLILGYAVGSAAAKARFAQKLPAAREDAVKRSRAVLAGQLVEQLAPYLPDFPWKPTEVRFLGKPIDFLVFRGLDEKRIEEVVFVEVKTGQSRLSGVERSLRDAVRDGRVSWAEWRGPREG